MKKQSGDTIWAMLEAELGENIPIGQPPNSVTVREFAANRGVTPRHASDLLNSLFRQGKLKQVYFRSEASGKKTLAYVPGGSPC